MNGTPEANRIADWIDSAHGRSVIKLGDRAGIVAEIDELMCEAWTQRVAVSGFYKGLVEFRISNKRWPSRAEIQAVLENVPVPVAGAILAEMPALSPEPLDDDAIVLHTPGTDRYHAEGCPKAGASAQRITLARAKAQVRSRPAQCCFKNQA